METEKNEIKLFVDSAIGLNYRVFRFLEKYAKCTLVERDQVDTYTIAIGSTTDIRNRRVFNLARYAIGIGPLSSKYADDNLPAQISFADAQNFVQALIVAWLYGDENDKVLEDIKNFLGKDYSMTGQWDAHADCWMKNININTYTSVRDTIYALINDFKS